jgi:hypothetical protein
MNELLWLAWSIVVGGLLGIKEGMIMDWGDIREQRWFKNYHAFGYAIITMLFVQRAMTLPDLNVLFACGVFAWETMEGLYAFTRYGRPFGDSENVLGIGLNIEGWVVPIIHAARIAAGILLITL